jgi:hypothetical protein
VKIHRFDPVSMLFGIVAIIIGVAATNARLGRLVNDRPDGLIPLVVLGLGVLAIAVAARRSLQDVDGASNDQHDGAE